jgi:hypothetical protein
LETFAHRIIDDYVAIYVGSTLLRTGKLLFTVLIIVHLYTCGYWLIKYLSAKPDSTEIQDFLAARQLDETVPVLPINKMPWKKKQHKC